MRLRLLFAAAFLIISSFALSDADQFENPRVQWMKGKYGIMVHWLYPYFGGDVDEIVGGFNIDTFMSDFESSGAEWLIFTAGQNTGAYCSPNKALEMYCGESHTPKKRDLLLEVASRVKKLGKRFIVYIPCEVRGNKSVREDLAWIDGCADPKTEFQKRWVEILREWSLRLGKLCDGWWVDGSYEDVAPHLEWEMWHSALRAGNPDAAVTFNPGLLQRGRAVVLHPDHDYTAGEVSFLVNGEIETSFSKGENSNAFLPKTAYYTPTKTLWHALIPIDSFWAAYSNWPDDWLRLPKHWKPFDSQKLRKVRPPLYSENELFKFASAFTGRGGAVTFNIGIYENGKLSDESVELVKKVGKRLVHAEK